MRPCSRPVTRSGWRLETTMRTRPSTSPASTPADSGVERPARRASRVTGAFDDATALRCSAASPLPTTTPTSYGRARPSTGTFSCGRLPERAYSADADVTRCEAVAPMADLVADLALDGRYAEAMTVNGLAFSAALGFDADPAVAAMPTPPPECRCRGPVRASSPSRTPTTRDRPRRGRRRVEQPSRNPAANDHQKRRCGRRVSTLSTDPKPTNE